LVAIGKTQTQRAGILTQTVHKAILLPYYELRNAPPQKHEEMYTYSHTGYWLKYIKIKIKINSTLFHLGGGRNTVNGHGQTHQGMSAPMNSLFSGFKPLVNSRVRYESAFLLDINTFEILVNGSISASILLTTKLTIFSWSVLGLKEKKRKGKGRESVRKKSDDLFLCYSRYSEKGQHIKCLLY
jgi:hypothetical protein